MKTTILLTRPGQVQVPGGESLAIISQRSFAALAEVMARHAGQALLLVGHMGLNKALLCAVMGLDLDRYWLVRQDTCCLNIIQYQPDLGYEIVTLNDTCHMAGLAP